MLRVLPGDLNAYHAVYGEGESLLLLHGLGSSTRDWLYQLDDFAKCCRVVTPDLRGYGQSNHPPGPYFIQQMSEDVFALVNYLEIPGFHLLGYSMGGAVALQFALDHANSVDKLVVVSSQPSFIPTYQLIKEACKTLNASTANTVIKLSYQHPPPGTRRVLN